MYRSRSNRKHLLMRGASLQVVQKHLGHTTPKMTQRYAHLSDDHYRSQLSKLDTVFGEFLPCSGEKIVRNEDLKHQIKILEVGNI
jgi:hypothetical protein